MVQKILFLSCFAIFFTASRSFAMEKGEGTIATKPAFPPFFTLNLPQQDIKFSSVQFIRNSHQFFLISHPLRQYKLDGTITRTFINTPGNSFSISPNGNYLTLIPFNRIPEEIHVVDLAKKNIFWKIPNEEDRIAGITFSPDNKYIIVEFFSHKIKMYNGAKKFIRQLRFPKIPFGLDLAYYYHIKLYKFPIKKPSKYHHVVLSFSPHSTYFATGTYDGALFFWNTKTGKTINFYQIYATFPSISWSSGEKFIAISSEKDPSITILEIDKKNYLATIHAQRLIKHFAFTGNNNLLTVTEDNNIRLWMYPKYGTYYTINPASKEKTVIAASLSDDNEHFIVLYKNNKTNTFHIDVWSFSPDSPLFSLLSYPMLAP